MYDQAKVKNLSQDYIEAQRRKISGNLKQNYDIYKRVNQIEDNDLKGLWVKKMEADYK